MHGAGFDMLSDAVTCLVESSPLVGRAGPLGTSAHRGERKRASQLDAVWSLFPELRDHVGQHTGRALASAPTGAGIGPCASRQRRHDEQS